MADRQQIEAIYPLTPMQEGLLFQTLSSGSWEYFQQMTYTLNGALDVPALKRAWEQVIARHAVLRTLFKWERVERPVQVVRQQVRLPWQDEDWRALSEAEQQARLDAFLIANRNLGFELNKAPVMRMTLIRQAADKHTFVWSYHHLLMDGWSAATVCHEVFTLYAGYTRGVELALPRPRPFRDYIAWLQQQDFSQAEAYWRQQLAGFQTPTPLGGSETSLELKSGQEDYEQEGTRLPPELITALQQFSRQQRVTLNTVLKGVWALLLSRAAQQEDVVFGTVVAGRPPHLAGVEAMVGVFINTLPVRVRVRADASLGAWLMQLQVEQAQMQQYEYTPLVQIRAWSEVSRQQPLFESILVFQNFPRDAAQQGSVAGAKGLSIVLADDDTRNNYPLTLTIGPDPGSQMFLYDCRRFKSSDIDRMLAQIETLIRHFTAHHDVRLRELQQLLDEAERQQQAIKELTFRAARALKLKSVKRKNVRL